MAQTYILLLRDKDEPRDREIVVSNEQVRFESYGVVLDEGKGEDVIIPWPRIVEVRHQQDGRVQLTWPTETSGR